MRSAKVAGIVAGLALTALVASCSSSGGGNTPAERALYYVSIGDSYASGYQPTGQGEGHTTTDGFAYQVVTLAGQRGEDLTLANFGCSGATTDSLLNAPGCSADGLGPGATPYDGETQIAAAGEFLAEHRGDIGLITVSIGGNDITKCAQSADAVGCLSAAIPTLSRNLAASLSQLRSAAGADVPIVGITYPDVYLASSNEQLASLSVLAFQTFINPALKKAYEAAGGTFVDVTQQTGAYDAATAKDRVCELTYYCQYEDIHPKTNGYALIAKLVVDALPPPVGTASPSASPS